MKEFYAYLKALNPSYVTIDHESKKVTICPCDNAHLHWKNNTGEFTIPGQLLKECKCIHTNSCGDSTVVEFFF